MSNVDSNMIDGTLKEKMWSDIGKTPSASIRGLCALPEGLKGSKCFKCGSSRMSGALITESSDELDPNVLCLECGYWRE